ncbi:unnamed protein product [Phytomonas sp. EM1]|nr:unnamed protein product [Phytomonas sp. EM1]|eukprot:CCW65839.1 unnamed protein product [Phytomonas sp. isolate EM1]
MIPEKRDEKPSEDIISDYDAQSEALKLFFEKNIVRNYVSFWWLGLINNFHYCLVGSASDDISERFNVKELLGLLPCANAALNFVVRFINTFCTPRLSYNIRFIITGLQTLIGIALVCVSWPIGNSSGIAAYVIALIGVVFCGNASAYGESVSLAFMECFPALTVGSWSSGTGGSGVLSSLIYLGLRSAGLIFPYIFLLSTPFILVYWVCYYFMIRIPIVKGLPAALGFSALSVKGEDLHYEINSFHEPPLTKTEEYYRMITGGSNWWATSWGDIPRLTSDISAEEEDRNIGAFERLRRWWRRKGDVICEIHRHMFANYMNLAIVYVAEYASQYMAPYSFARKRYAESTNFWISNGYVILALCYQIGVLISRSSLYCVRIKKVWIITLIQLLNTGGWFAQAFLLFISSDDEATQSKLMFALFVWMIFVGLMGGASYVNVFHNVLDQIKNEETDMIISMENPSDEEIFRIKQLYKEKAELAMNIGALYQCLGITLGSVLDVFYAVFVLGDKIRNR